eukprot:gene14701-19754_t
MALLKIIPFSFIQYDRIQYMDADILPHQNMDCLFYFSKNTFNTGNASPLNSGWYLAIPNIIDYENMKSLATKRLLLPKKTWNEMNGWGMEILPYVHQLYYRGGEDGNNNQNKIVKKWNFNGASLDQGLLLHYFIMNKQDGQLIDTSTVRVYNNNNNNNSKSFSTVSLSKSMELCDQIPPISMFYHFTGQSKPWSPLGYFYPNI